MTSHFVMNILVVVILLFSAQENYGLQSSTKKFKSENSSVANVTTSPRVKRYAPHLNPLYRNFDFFNNDGTSFDVIKHKKALKASKNRYSRGRLF